jgi:nucleotide-binding universal stress UspA family protein
MSAEVRRVVVGVSGSIANIPALRVAVDRAQAFGVPLVAVLAWTPVGGEFAYRCRPCPPILRVWQQAARDRLALAFDQTFGADPSQQPRAERMVVRAEPSAALIQLADEPTDLLVVGTGGRALRSRLFPSRVLTQCLRHAACPVLSVPPPEMLKDLRGYRQWPGDGLRIPPLARGFRT